LSVKKCFKLTLYFIIIILLNIKDVDNDLFVLVQLVEEIYLLVSALKATEENHRMMNRQSQSVSVHFSSQLFCDQRLVSEITF